MDVLYPVRSWPLIFSLVLYVGMYLEPGRRDDDDDCRINLRSPSSTHSSMGLVLFLSVLENALLVGPFDRIPSAFLVPKPRIVC